jgi:hypothetical protein
VGPRTVLDMQKRKFVPLPGLKLRPLGRPARSQSLYRLRYPGSLKNSTGLDYKMNIDIITELNAQPVIKFIEKYRSNYKTPFFECPAQALDSPLLTKRMKLYGEILNADVGQ